VANGALRKVQLAGGICEAQMPSGHDKDSQ
jgi:hypothetical protein